MSKEFYTRLGLTENCSESDIKKAYRKLALKYHPDKNEGDPEASEKFKEITEAYSVLSDPEKRSHYDRFGTAEPGHGVDPSDIFSQFSDLFGGGFDDFFGRANKQTVRKGSTVGIRLPIDLGDVSSGLNTTVSIDKNYCCDLCNGNGYTDEKGVSYCDVCQGTGQVVQNLGFMSVAAPCRVCNGTGKKITIPCVKCEGQGIVRKTSDVAVDVPPGVNTGDRIKILKEGNFEPGSHEPGDLIIEIFVKDHENFVRHNGDILTEIRLSFGEAVLGTTKQITTLQGETVDIKIPPYSQPNQKIVLPAKGVPPQANSRHVGDLINILNVEIPASLTSEELELVKKLEKLRQDKL